MRCWKEFASLWLCSALMLVSAAFAQNAPKAAYTLVPEDVIEITVRNHSDLDKTLTVLPDGKITFPQVGEMQASGKTPKVLAAEVQAELEKTLNNVSVSIVVKEMHARRVRVTGAVKSPGLYDLKPNWRLLDLVAVSGGLSAKAARINGRIVRGTAPVITLDVAQAIAKPDSDANMALEPDDLILFDEREVIRNQVHVIGQVAKPGAVELEEDTTLLTLLSQAGNPTSHAALTKVHVLRGATTIPLNLRPLLIEGKPDDAITGFKLQPNDLLVVPALERSFSVMGEVRSPSAYPLPEEGTVTVIQAINLAGGATGDLAKAGILRTVAGKPTVVPINIEKMLKSGNLADNVTLQPDDILYIPPRKARGFNWQDLLTPLSALSLLGFRLGR